MRRSPGIRSLYSLLLLALVCFVHGNAQAQTTSQTLLLSLDGDTSQAIHARVWLPPHPSALVVYTHGFVDNSRNQQRLFDHLLGHGYAVAGWDLIGHGTSFGMRGYVTDFADYVRALEQVVQSAVRTLGPKTPVYMLGHSLGGLITLRYCELHDDSVAGSLYLAPFLQPKKSFTETIMRGISVPLDCLTPKLALPHGVTNGMLFRDPTILAERSHDPYFFTRITIHLFRQFLAGIKAVQADAAHLTKPLFFQVAGDEFIVERSATEAFYGQLTGIAHKDMVLYPNSRHEPQSDLGREAVLSDLTGWLKDRERESKFRQGK